VKNVNEFGDTKSQMSRITLIICSECVRDDEKRFMLRGNYSVKNKKIAHGSRKNFISANQNDEVQNEACKESRNHGVQ
jgi:hypothetical protein